MSGSHDEIESFLDDVCAACKRVPAGRRETLRKEFRTHAETLAEDYQARGMPESESTKAAIKMMGDPERIGRAYIVSWLKAIEPGSSLVACIFGCVTIWIAFNIAVTANYLAARHGLSPMGGVTFLLLESLIVGWTLGTLAPKRASLGICVAVAWFVLQMLQSATFDIAGGGINHARGVDLARFTVEFVVVVTMAANLWASLARRLRIYWLVRSD